MLSRRPTSLLRSAGVLAALLAALFAAPTPASVGPEEAALRAVNTLAAEGDEVVLRHPSHTARFGTRGLDFSPRRGPSWSWSLAAGEVGGVSLPGLDLGGARPEADGFAVRYRRGALVEEYLARVGSLEQRFVLEAPPAASGNLTIRGLVTSAGAFEARRDGWRWRDAAGVVHLGGVSAYDAAGTPLPATMEVSATETRIVLDGGALATARYPVTIDPEIGAQFRVSDMGSVGGPETFPASRPAVAFNGLAEEYLVVWEGEDDTGGMVPGESEIFGQRLSAATGAPLGANDFRISDVGGTGDPAFDAFHPAVAYNSQDNEYLVVWYGDDNVGGLVNDEFEIFGQLLDGAGTPVGANDFRISDTGGTGDAAFWARDPDVVFNGEASEYLVVWSGEDNAGALVEGEFEIFLQRLDAAGAEVGFNDYRLSDMGPDGDPSFDADSPAVARNILDNEYLVVWHGDNDFLQADNELEIFSQRLGFDFGGDLEELGANDLRVSDMGPASDGAYDAAASDIAYSFLAEEYLVVWHGRDAVGDESEIFGQRLSAVGAQIGFNDFRISDSGGAGDLSFGAYEPAVVWDNSRSEYLVVWRGEHDGGPLAENEFEVHGERLTATGARLGFDDFRISAMGGIGDPTFDAFQPAVASAGASLGYLAVWTGDHNTGGLGDEEFEIFGARVLAPLFEDDFESGDTAAWSAVVP